MELRLTTTSRKLIFGLIAVAMAFIMAVPSLTWANTKALGTPVLPGTEGKIIKEITPTVNADGDVDSVAILDAIKGAATNEALVVNLVWTKGGEEPEIKAKVFDAAKAAKDRLSTIVFVSQPDPADTEEVGAAFSFDTSKIINTTTSVDMGISKDEEEEDYTSDGKLPAGTKALGIELEHEGDFPGPVEIAMAPDATLYPAGTTAYLYCINPGMEDIDDEEDKDDADGDNDDDGDVDEDDEDQEDADDQDKDDQDEDDDKDDLDKDDQDKDADKDDLDKDDQDEDDQDDEETLELVEGSPFTVGENGRMEFTLAYGAEYIISDQLASEKATTPRIKAVNCGGTIKLKAKFGANTPLPNKIDWTTSDKSVVTVDNGTVKGKKLGTATIRATAPGGKYSSCNVEVSLGKPANVKAVSAGSTKAKISWTKVANANKYEVYYATSKKGTYKKVATTKGLSYTKANLTTGKAYYFKVIAYAGSIKSADSKIDGVKPIPPTVKGIKAKAIGESSIQVNWSKASEVSGYVVQRATSKNGKYKTVATVKPGSTVKYVNKQLTNGKTYYYKVAAFKTVNKVKKCGEFSAKTYAKVK
ncbi:MAG: fibronectin type III domain-containing protein [Anaerovoracaceae bacterium]